MSVYSNTRPKAQFDWFDNSARKKSTTCIKRSTGELVNISSGEVVGKITNWEELQQARKDENEPSENA